MAVNRRRGEVAAMLDGREYRLCLTLGALAELEDAFAVDDLAALVERFSSGRLSARDILRVVGAGLRGGGAAIDDAELAGMSADGGLMGFARLAAELLEATFGAAHEGQGTQDPKGPQEAKTAPCPGTS